MTRTVQDAPLVERLIEIVKQFRGRRVVVLGDLVADEFVYGDIDRISREAPVLILEHRRTVVVPGAAGNAVANLKALGAEPLPVGVVGRDATGRSLLSEFRRRGIRRAGIVQEANRETPSKSRLLAGGVHTRRQQIVRIDRGHASCDLPRATHAEIRRRLARALDDTEGLLVADYGYGVATPRSVSASFARMRKRELPVLVDSRSRVAEFRGASACTPNQEELERALGLAPLKSLAEIETAGRQLLRRTSADAILVTRGACGMSLFQKRRPSRHIAAFGSDEVADVTGAGDTVIAVFTLALLCGASYLEAAHLSNYAAGLVVLKAGTATISTVELAAAIREDSLQESRT